MIVHPSLSLLSPTCTRTDLFTVVFCLVDDWMKTRWGSANLPRARRGVQAEEFSDAEVLTILLVGELCHCTREQAWLRQVRSSYHALFPRLLEASRFSRRAERLREVLRQFREAVLYWADADLEPLRILDTFPLPLCACYRMRQSSLPIPSACFGYNDRKRQFFYGLRPGLLITLSGFIVDVILAPGNCNDTPLLAHYLDECVDQQRSLRGQTWLADRGFQNARLAQWAQEKLGLTVLVRRREQPDEPHSHWLATLDRVRKQVERVLSVLTECFGIENLRVKTDWGLYRRTQAKATAYALACYFNRVLGRPLTEVAQYAV